MFIHVIQGQCFDVLRQPYDIYTKPFQKCCLRTYEGIWNSGVASSCYIKRQEAYIMSELKDREYVVAGIVTLQTSV